MSVQYKLLKQICWPQLEIHLENGAKRCASQNPAKVSIHYQNILKEMLSEMTSCFKTYLIC